MIKKYLLLAVLFTSFSLFSQEAYFLTGSNFTKYIYKTSGGSLSVQLQADTGSTYEMGYSLPLGNEKIKYSIGLTLNDYNAVAGSSSESYKWNTKFIGIQNALNYNFTVANYFQLSLKAGLNFSTMIYGKQDSKGAIYDLKGQDEFSGIFISPFVGVQTRYRLSDIGYLSFGYAFSKSLNPINTSAEKLSFNTNQILFGIHFNTNKN